MKIRENNSSLKFLNLSQKIPPSIDINVLRTGKSQSSLVRNYVNREGPHQNAHNQRRKLGLIQGCLINLSKLIEDMNDWRRKRVKRSYDISGKQSKLIERTLLNDLSEDLVLISLTIIFVIYAHTLDWFVSARLLRQLPYKPFSILFIIDIAVNFNTSFFHLGAHITNSKTIFLHYLKGYFLLDCLSLLPLLIPFEPDPTCNGSLILCSPGPHIWNILFFFRMFRLFNTLKQFEEIISILNDRIEKLMPMIKILFKGGWIIHLLACLWLLIDEVEVKNGQASWMNELTLQKEQLAERYAHAIYYLALEVFSLGGQALASKSLVEEISGIITAVISSIYLGFLFARINTLTKATNKPYKTEKKSIRNSKYLSWGSRIKASKYLDYLCALENKQTIQNNFKLTEKLSSSLRQEVEYQIKWSFLSKCKLLHDNFSKETLNVILSMMIPRSYQPNEAIFNQGDKGNGNLYIVAEGFVELFLNCRKKGLTSRIAVLKEGDDFGELQFFLRAETQYSVRSVSSSLIFSINSEDFLALIKKESKDFEKFCLIRDTKLIYNIGKFKCSSKFPDYYLQSLYLFSIKDRFKESILQKNIKKKKASPPKKIKRKQRIRISPFLIINQTVPNLIPESPRSSSSGSNFQIEDVDVSSRESKSDSFSSVAIQFKSSSIELKRNQEDLISITESKERAHELNKGEIGKSYNDSSTEKEFEEIFSKRESLIDKEINFNMIRTQDEFQKIHLLKWLSLRKSENLSFKDSPQISNFESVKEYEIYFPHNNVGSIIRSFNINKQFVQSTNIPSSSKAINIDMFTRQTVPSLKSQTRLKLYLGEGLKKK